MHDVDEQVREAGAQAVVVEYQDRAPVAKTDAALCPVMWSDIDLLPRPEYLVKGLLETTALSLLFGPSGSGKTFTAFDIAAHVSLGWDWQGCRTPQTPVLYVAAEGGLGTAQRLQAFAQSHNVDTDRAGLAVLPQGLDLLSGHENGGDIERLIECAHDLEAGLIVVDTLARVMPGGNENTSEDMGRVIGHCDKLKAETGAHVMLVHHTGKDEKRGARGHSSLTAAVDTEIECKRDQWNHVCATVTKQRNAVGGQSWAFNLKSVDVDTDADGDPIRSCVLVPAEVSGNCPRPPRGGTGRALEALRNTLVDKGEVAPETAKIGGQVQSVRLENWKEECKRAECWPGQSADSFERSFRRAASTLADQGFTGMRDGRVWLLRTHRTLPDIQPNCPDRCL